MYFLNSELRKLGLDKCLKNSLSEDPCNRNMVNGPKHCCNMDNGNFTIFADHCEHNSIGKRI